MVVVEGGEVVMYGCGRCVCGEVVMCGGGRGVVKW